jgi:hypothetical protein
LDDGGRAPAFITKQPITSLNGKKNNNNTTTNNTTTQQPTATKNECKPRMKE